MKKLLTTFSSIVLSGIMIFNVQTGITHANEVDTPSEPTTISSRVIAGPPTGTNLNWKLKRTSSGWDDGYYVVTNTYYAPYNGRTAGKDETWIYKDSTKKVLLYHSYVTYWM